MMKLLKIKPWSLHQNVVPFLETNHGYEYQHKGLVIQKKMNINLPILIQNKKKNTHNEIRKILKHISLLYIRFFFCLSNLARLR